MIAGSNASAVPAGLAAACVAVPALMHAGPAHACLQRRNHALAGANALAELAGHVWQWTNRAYPPYPGFRAAPGAVGEYNDKFMINTMVLRGGLVATPPGHARPGGGCLKISKAFFSEEKKQKTFAPCRRPFLGARLWMDTET